MTIAMYLCMHRKQSAIKATAIICIVLALQGCTALAGPKVEQPVDDKKVVYAIKDKMASDVDLRTLKIDVTVKNGDVVLSGVVPNRKIEVKLIKLALGVTGVKSVKDNITIRERQP